MKVLVIGGMGIIGGAISIAAKKKGYDVWILSRREIDVQYKELGIKSFKGSWRDDSFAKTSVSEKFDIIVDTLIFCADDLKRDAEIVEGFCKQFYYISSDAVYVHPNHSVREDDFIDEDKLRWDYGINKRRAENYLIKHSSDYSFEWTIIRPTVTFDKTRIPVGFSSRKNEWTLVDRINKNKPIVLFDSLGSRHPLCCTETFGGAVVDTFLVHESYNQCLHIANDECYTYDEIYHVLSDVLGKEICLVRFQASQLKLLDKNKYDEMIYDKNPEFTLSNEKIKQLSQNTNYSLDLKKTLCETISYLQVKNANRELDNEYNWVSDIILMKNKKRISNNQNKEYVDSYIKSFSNEYIRFLKRYEIRLTIKNLINNLVRKVKNIIKKIISFAK